MANKDRQKRSVRKARAEERARVEAAQAASAPAGDSKATKKAEPEKAVAKAEKNKKPGFFKRIANWFGDVKTEMRRVTWPSPSELRNYSVAIIIMLVVFGLILWLVDTGIVAGFAAYTGLRG